MEKKESFFRAGVGALIINDDKYVMSFQRSDHPSEWQAPQGGMMIGETPDQAVMREIEEETGLMNQDIVLLKRAPNWVSYEFPESFRNKKYGYGQTQFWYLFKVLDKEIQIDLSLVKDKEFQDWDWFIMEQAIERVPPFKRKLYIQLYDMFRDELSH